jgi:hypothetical protein
MRRSFSLLVVVVSILIVFGSACTLTHNIRLDPNLGSLPAVEKEPVTLGVYYSEEFRKYVHQQALGSDWQVVHLGEASVALFDRILESACEQVIPVSQLPDGEPVAGVAAILEPRIEAFQVAYWGQQNTEDFPRITFRIILYTPEGLPTLSQVIQGRGKEGTINSDLEDAGRKFLGGFSTWYKSYLLSDVSQGIQAEPFDQSLVSATAEPYTNKVETKEGLKYPFSKAGVIAIRVTMRNDCEREVLMRGSDMHLLLSDGSRIVPACATVVIERLEEERHAADTAIAWLMPFGTTLAVIGQAGDRKTSRVDLNSKQLGDKKLAPGETAEGLIYFVPTEGTPAFTNAKLEVWCVDPATLCGLRLELPLNDLTFAPVKYK